MNNELLPNYEQAQSLMQGTLTNRIVMNDAVFPHWISDSDFWYKRETSHGMEFRLVDANTGINILAFDHKLLANVLSKEIGKDIDYQDLPIRHVRYNQIPIICSI